MHSLVMSFVSLALISAFVSLQQPDTVRVAAIQCSSVLGDVEGNREKLLALTEKAAKGGAKIVVLPECSVTGYLSQDLATNWHLDGWPLEKEFKGKDPEPFAEPVDGVSTKAFAALAKKLGIYVTVPFLEIVRGEKESAPKFFNTVCLASPEGRIVAHYRKLTPWPFPEKSWATKGDRDVQTFDTEYGRVGLAICFDIHTILDRLQPKKIWALLYPIAWVSPSHPADWFWHILPGRIKKYGHYVVGANWSVDQPQSWFGYGFSTIYGPDGTLLASSQKLYGDDILYAELKTQKR